MPVKSLNSSVLIWPDHQSVVRALRDWAQEVVRSRPGVIRIGYFGSYARGDWGVGSDLDVLLIVSESDVPFERRAAEWDLTSLPLPADVLVYTPQEWKKLAGQLGFGARAAREVVWVYERAEG